MLRATAFTAAVFCLAAAPAPSEVVRVDLRGAGPEAISRQLELALRTPVRVEGARGKTVTLNLATASPSLTLDRVAALLGGTWSMKLRVRPAQPGNAPVPTPRPLLERSLAVGIQDLPADRAFALIARELRADLEVEGELKGRVSLPAASLPVTALLDRLAEQASASWSVQYVLTAPDAPPLPEPRERDLDIKVTPLPPPAPRPQAPALRTVPPVPLSATTLKQGLWADVNDLVRASPEARTAAVRQFLETAGKRLATLAPLSPAERAGRLRAAKPVLTQWRRLYAGLAPTLREELRPAAELLERQLGP